MKLTRFILAVHCHQPVGNFGWVFEEAYQSAYRPFVDVLERHPKVRVVFHYSGPLLDWFEARHPDFLKRLKKLVQRGQAEFLGSGYYEPVLILLPEKDALGQLAWMERALGRLGLEPKAASAHGIWLAERVWEPGLVRLLAQAGIKYTVVDDNHLALAGIPENERFGYYLTEDRGASVAVFPSSKPLRYAVPFKPVEEVIDLLKGYASERQQTVVLGDDGEKFGLWPGTHNWVYEEGWLEKFFTALEQNADWLKMTTFREAIAQTTPLGRVYMPVSSYEEMVGWSRGTFRNFLSKYSESDAMHKKMLWISGRLEAHNGGARSDRRLSEAKRRLYMAQSNDAYWHGVFGGLYLRHLRRSVYENLLEAERELDAVEEKGAWVRAEQRDLDADGWPEILLRSKRLTLTLDPDRGGQLVELSDKESGFNYMDTLARREEAYHAKLREKSATADGHAAAAPATIHERQDAFQPELLDLLVYDRNRRVSLIDHLLAPGETVQAFAKGEHRELADPERPYAASVSKGKGSVTAAMKRSGPVATITKKVALSSVKPEFEVNYGLSNPSGEPVRFLFAVEWNVGLKDAHVNRVGEAPGVKCFSVSDPAVQKKISWSLDKEARLWYFPVETVSDSEKGVERNYQGACLTFVWDVNLPPRGATVLRCSVKIESSDEKQEKHR